MILFNAGTFMTWEVVTGILGQWKGRMLKLMTTCWIDFLQSTLKLSWSNEWSGCKTCFYSWLQTCALWVTTTRRIWWRSCSPWWLEISKRPRSEITWLPVKCERWKLPVCVWHLCSGPRKLCKVRFGYKGRVRWRQREIWSGLEHHLPLQHHPSVAASKQESAGLVRGAVCSSAHKNLHS